jgi:type IV secretory pathway TraG/TraD family ATPase VirD4
MAPFQSAYKNKANDQLEGMVGTLRVNAARLVSPEAYWVFTGDDFDLKISDRNSPSYLVIANDPEKEQVIGSLNALILNRLVTRINSKGNLPVSIIVDELPTLYFHKIDRLIGTARSNKVAVILGFQELPQLEADYGKNGMQKIITTCGNIFMGAARNKETLEWAQNDVFGKAKQTSKSITINDSKVSTSISEKMDNLVPAAKIADMATGWLAGQAARTSLPQSAAPSAASTLRKARSSRRRSIFARLTSIWQRSRKKSHSTLTSPKSTPSAMPVRRKSC